MLVRPYCDEDRPAKERRCSAAVEYQTRWSLVDKTGWSLGRESESAPRRKDGGADQV